MLDMMDMLRRFLKQKKMMLSVEKTKIMICNKGRKEKKERWKWRKEYIEEVQTFKYLGFVFNKDGNYKDHIKELCRKGRMAANKMWGLGERICRDDFVRRWMLFKYLVQSVMTYGVEIWGWEEKNGLEKIMMDYVRWIFRLDFCTPRYVIYRELKSEKLKIGWGIRTVRYEEKISRGTNNRWLGKCIVEKEEKGWRDRYGKERESYYNRNGLGALNTLRNDEERDLETELMSRERDVQRQWEERKIREAKYNTRYKQIGLKEDGPKYLRKDNLVEGRSGDEVRGLVRLRCGNMEEVNRYWKEEKDWKCIFCRRGEDNLKHFVEECEKTKD